MFDHGNHDHNSQHAATAELDLSRPPKRKGFLAPHNDKSGNLVVSSALANPFSFTGREYDAEVSIYYYRARAYDPTTGRFMERDPLGCLDGPSQYEYVGSSPATFTDPMGEMKYVGIDPKQGRSDAEKDKINKKNDAERLRLAEAGRIAKAIMKWLLGNRQWVFTQIAKNWKFDMALDLLNDFFDDNGCGPRIQTGFANGWGRTRFPSGWKKIDPTNLDTTAEGEVLFKDARGWRLVWSWLHEFIHWAAGKMKSEGVDINEDRATPDGTKAKDGSDLPLGNNPEVGDEFGARAREVAKDEPDGDSPPGEEGNETTARKLAGMPPGAPAASPGFHDDPVPKADGAK